MLVIVSLPVLRVPFVRLNHLNVTMGLIDVYTLSSPGPDSGYSDVTEPNTRRTPGNLTNRHSDEMNNVELNDRERALPNFPATTWAGTGCHTCSGLPIGGLSGSLMPGVPSLPTFVTPPRYPHSYQCNYSASHVEMVKPCPPRRPCSNP